MGNVALSYQYGFWAGGVIPLGLAICLVLTGLFFGRTFNRMNMITLADFYFRRYGNTAEIMSGTLMSIRLYHSRSRQPTQVDIFCQWS